MIRFKLLVRIVLGVVLLGIAGIIGLTLLGPAIAAQYPSCLADICPDKVYLRLTGDVPADFSVEAIGADGKNAYVVCNPKSGTPSYAGCDPDSIELVWFRSSKVTITVTWKGGQKIQVFHPAYQDRYPYGPQCETVCHEAHLTMSLP